MSIHGPAASVTVSQRCLVACQESEPSDRLILLDEERELGVTAGDLGRRIRRVAGGLEALGHGPGQVLALWAPNMPPWAGVLFGAWTAGMAVTPIGVAASDEEVERQLVETGASVLVAAPGLMPRATALASRVDVRTIVSLGPAAGAVSILSLLESPPLAVSRDDPDATALLPYSSGTTGGPKAVQLTHRQLAAVAAQLQSRLRFDRADVVLGVPPFSHILGLTGTLTVPLLAGAQVVTLPRFDPRTTLDVIARRGVTVVIGAPSMVDALARGVAVHGAETSSVRLVLAGGSALMPDVQARASLAFPRAVVGQGWG
ncbi:MAG: AMP-binding protein [Vicinamibacterales bacterium]